MSSPENWRILANNKGDCRDRSNETGESNP
jgi:hypothetical protein